MPEAWRSVTNAFRQRVLFGLAIAFLVLNAPGIMSPMPFGSESSSDSTPHNILGLRNANGS